MHLVAKYSVVWLVLWTCSHDSSNARVMDHHGLQKRQATHEVGGIATEFGTAFVEMFGEGGFNVKSLIVSEFKIWNRLKK